MEANNYSLRLPERWTWIKVGDINNKLQYGSSEKANGDYSGIPVIRMGNIKDSKIIYDNLKYFSLDSPDLDEILLEDGDVLFNRTNSPELVGKAAVYRNRSNDPKAVFASYLIRIKVKKSFYDPELLSLFINSFYGREFIKSVVSQMVGQANVNGTKLAAMPIPLAPLAEQHRIVARIEELFSRLDVGVEALQKAKAQLQRYRQAVLKAAVEGRLTEEWRKTHQNVELAETLLESISIKEAELPDEKNRPQLPYGWAWASLEQLSEQIVDCLHSTPEFASNGKYCIDTTCIEPGRILFDKARFVSEEIYRERIRRLKPEAGDILFSREGTIGTAITVLNNVEFCLGQRMMMFRPSDSIIPAYFMWAMLSDTFKKQWEPKVTGTTAPHVNIRDLRVMVLPLTSVAEQVEIIDEIESKLSLTDEIERIIGQNLIRAVRFRQSILKLAFEGRLVPQDPSDEPVSVLLERIKTEKAKESPRRARRNNSIQQMRLIQ